MKLSAEQAKTILDANLINLAKKVKEGETLGKADIALLESVAGGATDVLPDWVQNQVELAKLLSVNRKTIQRWLKEPGNPGAESDGRYNVALWREFAKLRGHEFEDDDPLEQTALRAKNLLLQNQTLEFKLAIMRKEYVPAADVEKWGGELGAAIRKVATQIHLAAPGIVGSTVPEAETRLKELEDEILHQLHSLADNMAAWKETDEPAS